MGTITNPTRQLHDLGQSLWLDNISRDLLTSGTLKRYIDEFSLTGLTSNPTIFHQAIKGSSAYDASIRSRLFFLDGFQLSAASVSMEMLPASSA